MNNVTTNKQNTLYIRWLPIIYEQVEMNYEALSARSRWSFAPASHSSSSSSAELLARSWGRAPRPGPKPPPPSVSSASPESPPEADGPAPLGIKRPAAAASLMRFVAAGRAPTSWLNNGAGSDCWKSCAIIKNKCKVKFSAKVARCGATRRLAL